MDQVTIGIDISKDRLDAHRHPDGAAQQFANTRGGLTQLIRWIGTTRVERVVFEATGRYHRDLEGRLGEAGFPLAKVNPRQVKRFAQSFGVRAKTDRADAAMLARMGAALALVPHPAKPEIPHHLNDLGVARRALIQDRPRKRTGRKGCALRSWAALIGAPPQIDADLETIDNAISQIIAANPELWARRAILVSIAGISEVTAAAILTMMPELGNLDRKQAASLAGLAPVTRQSGRWRGKAFIQGGRAALRQALYMPAVVASRFNPDLKAKYDQLIAAGKPAKVAISAIMRRLIILANALIRDKRLWEKSRP